MTEQKPTSTFVGLKVTLSIVLMVVGIIGYLVAAYFFFNAARADFDSTFIHRGPIAEDQPGGLDGLVFIIEAGAGVVVAGVASVFFVPGIVLWNKVKISPLITQTTQPQSEQAPLASTQEPQSQNSVTMSTEDSKD